MKHKKISNVLAAGVLSVMSISIFAQGSIVSVSDVGAIYSSGKEYCKSQQPGDWTCIPIYNNSTSATLHTHTDDHDFIDLNLLPGHLGYYDQAYTRRDSINFLITLTKSGKIIYDGPAKNKEGLICTSYGCIPWR